jgi:hypothetical protein
MSTVFTGSVAAVVPAPDAACCSSASSGGLAIDPCPALWAALRPPLANSSAAALAHTSASLLANDFQSALITCHPFFLQFAGQPCAGLSRGLCSMTRQIIRPLGLMRTGGKLAAGAEPGTQAVRQSPVAAALGYQ